MMKEAEEMFIAPTMPGQAQTIALSMRLHAYAAARKESWLWVSWSGGKGEGCMCQRRRGWGSDQDAYRSHGDSTNNNTALPVSFQGAYLYYSMETHRSHPAIEAYSSKSNPPDWIRHVPC